MCPRRRGFTLLELLIGMAVVGLFLSISMPHFQNLRRRTALRAASQELRAIFHLARSRAIARNTNCGMKFLLLGGEWHFAIYDDGDRDGVRNDDIKKGIDVMVAPPRVVFPVSNVIRIGLITEPVRDPDGDLLKSPVAFNNSAICSFSPVGESTPGSIYLTDRGFELYAVRVLGVSARIRVLQYDRGKKKWVP